MFAGGAILVVFIPLMFIWQITLPLTAEAMLENPLPPAFLFTLAAIGEFLLMPGVLGLYLALKDIRKNHMLIATAVWLISIPMFLVSRGQIIALLAISDSYTAATNEALRAAYLVSAEVAIEVANLYNLIALSLLQSASIIVGIVIRKGIFGKRIGYLVIVAGILGVLGSFGVLLQPLAFGTLFGLILNAIWQTIIGAKLYKLG